MTTIDASLFAHIENDAHLSGTFQLEGNDFLNTIGYLRHYLETLTAQAEVICPEYTRLVQSMDYLIRVEMKLKYPFLFEELVTQVTTDVLNLQKGQTIYLPGGWEEQDNGHEMIYEFTRTDDGYLFKAINTGAGLEYHPKKSSLEKELYNPVKTWHFPTPTSQKRKKELALFVEQLLQPQLPFAHQKKAVTAKILYEQILPKISYFGGKEIKYPIPQYGYTGGQLSGTCTERCLHQLLKLFSPSKEYYERFIFKFKHFALFDYANACLNGQQPFNPEVREQLNLAIENNLKILDIVGLFPQTEKAKFYQEIKTLQKKINCIAFPANTAPTDLNTTVPSLFLDDRSNTFAKPHFDLPARDEVSNLRINLGSGENLNQNLAQLIDAITNEKNQAARLFYLEKLILQLPLNNQRGLASPFYSGLKTVKDCSDFEQNLDKIQCLLSNLQSQWLQEAQIPVLNVLVLNILSLQADVKETLTRKLHRPSYSPFTDAVMDALLNNHGRNPYWATNNPILDERFTALQKRFSQAPNPSNMDDLTYYAELLATEPQLTKKLKRKYHASRFAVDTSYTHTEIRTKGLEALFMISLHLESQIRLDAKFYPLIQKVYEHLHYENKLSRVIKPFFIDRNENTSGVHFGNNENPARIYFGNHEWEPFLKTPFDLSHFSCSSFTKALSHHKYDIKDSLAKQALDADMPEGTHLQYKGKIKARTANHIQLFQEPGRWLTDPGKSVTQTDIIARDYYHLRCVPEQQIPLTLDYFTRHIGKLVDESDKRFVEANLFQPGLLLQTQSKPFFLPQFDRFLETGFRYFNKKGQHSRDSLLFVRLDYLVSRYIAFTNKTTGLSRLKALQQQLVNQLSEPNSPDITYVQQQYLFLTLLARIELGEDPKALFTLAFDAFFYIQGHINPHILEDTAHQIAVERAIAQFQRLANEQPEEQIIEAIRTSLQKYPYTKKLTLVGGKFPRYVLKNGEHHAEINVYSGKLSEKKLTQSGVPFNIQNHPLIKSLGLENHQECLSTADKKYMLLPSEKQEEVHLFYDDNNLIVQKNWRIQGRIKTYELRPLTTDHLAKHANKSATPVVTSLPKVLTDSTVDYWRDITSKDGLLVQDHVPIYAFKAGRFIVLDKAGKETAYQLTQLHSQWAYLLHRFESMQFTLTHSSTTDTLIKLPRYGLEFKIDLSSREPSLVHQHTGEKVVDTPSPIDPAVAGLVLENDRQTRYLVPVARFYATLKGAKPSAFYPVIHDINGTIATETLKAINSQSPIPQWNYQNSERAISFRLQDGEPIPDTVADALYLAYLFLATNQTQKAWKVLEYCNTHLGGVTGDPAELQFISWICNDLPHVLPTEKNKVTRSTPRYVACQLKAMSLLSDYLLQDRQFNLSPPSAANTANALYQQKAHEQLTKFLNELPNTIYSSFQRLQSMRRHLEHDFQLSVLERKRLLDYCQQSPLNLFYGAIGYEWMSLNLEQLQEQLKTLKFRNSGNLSDTDKKQLAFIEKQIRAVRPVQAKSTNVELITINLDLPEECGISAYWVNSLSNKTQFNEYALQIAINALSSNISEKNFFDHFPAYFQIACTAEQTHRQQLLDFCTQTLIATRYVPFTQNSLFDQQKSAIPLLCNVLYRVLHNPSLITEQEIGLNKLLTMLSNSDVPPLQVSQAEDHYHDVLARPEDLLSKEQPIPTPLQVTEGLHALLPIQTETNRALGGRQEGEQLQQLIKNYCDIEEKTTQAIEALGKTLTYDLEQRFEIERQAGKLLFAQEQGQKALAKNLIENPTLTTPLLDIAYQASPSLILEEQTAWSEALNFANQGPESPEMAQSWKIKKRAKRLAKLSKADLLSLYCNADMAYSIEKTGLNAAKVQQLHHLIHRALVASIQNQTNNKIVSHLENTLKTKDIDAALQALELLARKEIPGLDESATVVLQYAENILLRKRQESALKRLLTPLPDGSINETLEKIMPGGGKSKVVIPVLAEKKALGNNLVVVEVPPASLPTNHIDLNSISQRLYGKRAHRFEFNRNSNCSPKRLEQLYQHFTEIMATRCYLVTTGESIQSLELKYSEFLLSDKPHDAVWQQQVYWLDKITDLFRNQADCIIDEAHLGLCFKKKLNYTFGEPNPIGSALIKTCVALFNFIDTEFIKKAPFLDTNYDWEPFKKNLATQLIKEPNSPLRDFIDKAVLAHGEGIKEKLIAYLLDKELCEAVTHASTEEKEVLGILKNEINTLLPETLRQKLNVKYGASRLNDLTPLQYTLPIPYSGNNAPNENSRDGNEIVAVNRAIQMMLIKGISRALFKERISAWQIQARQELFANPHYKHLDETPTARGFATLEGECGLRLSQVNLADASQIESLYQRHKNNRPLIFSILQESSLKQINLDPSILSSDSFNHVDLYRSVQLLTGTPANHMTLHHRIHYDATASLGTDGYILEVLDAKNTRISSLDYQGVRSFVEHAIGHSCERARIRAIIDINATFNGVSNDLVARELARYAHINPNHFNNPIKHVLYFNAENVLYALDISKPNEPIKLGTSDEKEIQRILGSTPNERLTYFDQFHASGTDLEQTKDAHALALVDDDNLLLEYIQGDWRMRWLHRGQSLELITPKRLEGVSRQDLTKRLVLKEKTILLADVLSTGKSQLVNFMRRHSLTLIQGLPSENGEQKSVLAKKFRCFLEEKSTGNYFNLYGGISEEKDVEGMLKTSKTELLALLTGCYESAGIPLPEQTRLQVDTDLQHIIDNVLPWCPKKYKSTRADTNKEVQIQIEAHRDLQFEREQAHECYRYSTNLWEKDEESWEKLNPFSALISNKTKTINELRSTTEPPLFSETLRVSNNYAYNYKEQRDYLNAFVKPVFLVWYHYEGDVLHATVVTPQELEDLEKCIKDLPGKNWIASTQDTVVSGARPEAALCDQQYLRLREQVRFFNGEFNLLMNQVTPLLWLKEQPVEKMTFFETKLQIFRPGCEMDFQQLKTSLVQPPTETFVYITAHPFDDLSHFDWKHAYPQLIPTQIAECKKLAEAFAYANQMGLQRDLTAREIQEKFSLPLNCLGYIGDHLNHLQGLKELLAWLSGKLASSPSTKQEECFARYLGISLELFCQSNQITALHGLTSNLEEAKQRQLAAIKAILIIQKQLHLKEGVADYFLSLLKRSQSTDALRELLKAENLNEAFFIEFLQHPLCDSTLIENLLSSKHEFSDQHLKLMLQRCDSEECFNQCMDKLLQKATIGDEVLTVLLKRKEINEKQLVDLVLRAQTTEALAQISQHPAASDEVQEAILLHSQCSSELFTAIINRGLLKPLTAEVAFKVLRVFGQQAIPLLPVREMAELANENDIDLMINQIGGSVPSNNSKTHFLFKDLIKKCFAQLALSNNPRWENRLLQIAQKYPVDSDLYKEVINFICEHPLSERLALKLLLHGGHAVADALPFEEAFLIADESEVKILLNAFHSSPLSEECLIKLVKKTKDLEIMQSILQREVGHNVLQAILNKNLDYPTLQLALTHKQFSKEKQRAWLDHLADTQTTLQEKAQSTAHPDKALIASLHALKVKACHHAVRALTDEAYKDVAQASFDLYGTLRQEIEQFFQAPCYPSEFIRECSKEVEKSRGILATHRGGIGQLLIDILSAILAVATLKFIRSDSHKWDFFETKTASLQIVEELQVNIKRCAQEATQNQSRQTSNSEPSSTTPYPHQRNRFFYQAGQESWEQSQFVPVVSY